MSRIKNGTEGKPKRPSRPANRRTRMAYVYEIIVDSVTRYIGKGSNGRLFSHMKAAKCTAKRCGESTDHLGPRVHRKLVEALRAGSLIHERILVAGLSDAEAYRIEYRLIGNFHKNRAGQLWNTIDERFLDPQYLPNEFPDPENPLYRLSRPLQNNDSSLFYIRARKQLKVRPQRSSMTSKSGLMTLPRSDRR
jgi:hypothetical protein